ncbi:MAG: hypothetical protein IT435_10780 [Phycisphaerales bacterium]|nr:hypothetical protein [Phycisphaerales bacterium]
MAPEPAGEDKLPRLGDALSDVDTPVDRDEPRRLVEAELADLAKLRKMFSNPHTGSTESLSWPVIVARDAIRCAQTLILACDPSYKGYTDERSPIILRDIENAQHAWEKAEMVVRGRMPEADRFAFEGRLLLTEVWNGTYDAFLNPELRVDDKRLRWMDQDRRLGGLLDRLNCMAPADAMADTGESARTPPAASSALPATSASSGPKWTQEQVDEKIRGLRRDHAGIVDDLVKRLNAGDKTAIKEARLLFGRNQIAEKYKIHRPMVSNSSAWKGIAAELGLRRGKTVRPTRVGMEVAISRKAAPGPDPATATSDKELTALMAKLPLSVREDIESKRRSGEYTVDNALEVIRCALDQAEDADD